MKKIDSIQNRKYYLHKKLKKEFKVVSKERTVYMTTEESTSLVGQTKVYVSELQNKYHYQIRLTI